MLPKKLRRTSGFLPEIKKEMSPGILLAIIFLINSFLFTGPAEAAAAPRLRLIVTATEQEAREILAHIRRGNAFALIAKERSIDQSREHYGELDSHGLSQLGGPLRAAVSSMREGDLSRVIRIDADRYALMQYIDLRHYRLGAAAFRAGDFRSAEKHLLRHLDDNPDAVKARLMLGEIYETRGLAEKALTVYGEVLVHDPGNQDAEIRKTRLSKTEKPPSPQTLPSTELLSKIAEPQQEGKDSSSLGSVGAGEPAGKTISPAVVPVRIIIVDSRQRAEDILNELRRGKPFFFLAHDNSIEKKSAEEYGDLGTVDPLTLHPALRDALLGLQPGQISGVIRLGEGSYAIIQRKDTIFSYEAEKASAAGDLQGAEHYLLKHLRLNPEDAEARMQLASLYETRRNFAGAEDAYFQALVFKPRDPGPYERLGKLYLEQHNYAKARDIFGKGLSLPSARRLFEKLMEIANISLLGTVQ
ncbi:MAG: hypothetical protein C0402_09560 [Thermodesulfovibrio sp.]|nr:hypothetical protein [Thermodesulfovibrio sp.]